MQRILVMIRHAKSSWANPLQSDYERPLNDRGEHDAPMMGERMKDRKIVPDLIISSTAKRAAQTAKKIAKAVGYDPEQIQWRNRLYQCVDSVFSEVIQEAPADAKTVFVVAHNPGITEFVNEMSPRFRVDNMPTCGMAVISLEADDWADFSMAEKNVILFDYPKKQA